MKKTIVVFFMFLGVALLFSACGGSKSPEAPAGESGPASQPAASVAAPAPARAGFTRVIPAALPAAAAAPSFLRKDLLEIFSGIYFSLQVKLVNCYITIILYCQPLSLGALCLDQ